MSLWGKALALHRDHADLKGHRSNIHKIMRLPGDDRIITASEDGTARIFSMLALTRLHTFRGHRKSVLDATAVDKDNVVSVGEDGMARIWRLCDGTELHAEYLAKYATSCAVLRGGSVVFGVWGLHCKAKLVNFYWNGTVFKFLREVYHAHNESISAIATHGIQFATASLDSSVKLWNSATLECLATLLGHTDGVLCVAMGEEYIVTGSKDKTLRVYDANEFRFLRGINAHCDWVCTAHILEDGKTVISGSDDEMIATHRLTSGCCLWRLHVGIKIRAMAILPHSRVAIAGGEPHSVQVFEVPYYDLSVRTKRSINHDSQLREPPYEVFISHAGPDKKRIAVPLYQELTARGVSCFLDQIELYPGDDAQQSMIIAMETAPILTAITSPEFCTRKWTIVELQCFLQRDLKAKGRVAGIGLSEGAKPRPGEADRPVIIPVFYRMSVQQCRYMNLLNDVTDEDEYNMKRYNDMVNNSDLRLQIMKACMASLTEHTGIENKLGATNEDTDEMRKLRAELIKEIADAVERAVREWRKRIRNA